jgi:diguanylate cyclase (GGDEF)-like protein/PAS domain S-box-containing protein
VSVAVGIVVLAVALIFHLHERMDAWFAKYPSLHLGEVFMVLIALAFVFAAMSVRRWRELAREIARGEQAEEALRQSEAGLRTVIDAVVASAFIIQDGRLVYVNDACERLTGYSRDELLEMDVWQTVHPDSLKMLQDDYQKYLQRGEDRSKNPTYEVRLVTKEGGERWVDFTVGFIELGGRPAVMGTAYDITERKRAEDQLRASEERYRSLAENSFDLICEVDTNARFTYVSPNYQDVLGYAPDQLLGKNAVERVHPDDLASVTQELARVLQGRTSGRVSFRYRDGRDVWRWFEGVGRAFEAANGEVRVVVISRDITEKKRSDDARERHAKELEQLNAQLLTTHEELAESRKELLEKSKLLEAALELERDRARRDPLTGTLNHAAIVDELRALIAKRRAEGASDAVAMVDVDGLKAVNDTMGHQVGDGALITVAKTLSTNGTIVGRYGGDEFVAIVPGADRAKAERYRDAVLAALRNASLTDPETGAKVTLSASVGIAVYPGEAENVADLIRLSDSAMYAAKRQRPVVGELASASVLPSDRARNMVGEIVPLLTSPGDLNEKLGRVAQRLSIGAGYDAVNFSLYEGLMAKVPSPTFGDVQEDVVAQWTKQQNLYEGKHPIRMVVERTRRPLILTDPQHDERLTDVQRDVLSAAGIRSALVAPMIWENELVGLLSVGCKRDRAFTPRDAQFLTAVATQVTAISRMTGLVDRLQTASVRLADAQAETVMLLAAAAEAHDTHTGLHLHRIRTITEAIAHELGWNEDEASALGLAAVLHDIGKVRVTDTILSSTSQLSDEEWVLMKKHTVWGAELLAGRTGFELAASIARSHHERWDGSGYPDGLARDEIPEPATIVSVADSLDAMINDRPYRKGRPLAEAVQEVMDCSGRQFSPRVAHALRRLYRSEMLPLATDKDPDDHHEGSEAAA